MIAPATPFYLFALVVWIFTASLITLAYILLVKGEAILAAVASGFWRTIAWLRRTCALAPDPLAFGEDFEVAELTGRDEERRRLEIAMFAGIKRVQE